MTGRRKAPASILARLARAEVAARVATARAVEAVDGFNRTLAVILTRKFRAQDAAQRAQTRLQKARDRAERWAGDGAR